MPTIRHSNRVSPEHGLDTKMLTYTANSSTYENQQDLQTVRLSQNYQQPAQVESAVSVNDIENNP